MKKIFYSLMAVALCSCAQSDVEDVVTPPQPENNGVKFMVVDNGFVGEDGTRVTYGSGADAYKAKFDNGDEIGVYAIKSADMADNGTPNAYVVENAKLTLTDGIWKGSIDFKDADLLFAYSPYRENVNLGDGAPLFTGAQGSWAVSTDNNRFFVWDYLNQDNGTKEKFDAADWMGAATNITSGQTEITFNMIHMRGMVELTTDKGVELTDLTLAVDGDNGAQYHFTPYLFNENDANRSQNVYRILTTEYRSQNTVYATIKDGAIEKKYKKTLTAETVGAGKCAQVNIAYTPAPHFEAGQGTTLASYLEQNPSTTNLRLSGTLSPEDFTALQDFANKEGSTLTTLDMSGLTNDALIDELFNGNTALTKLYLPNGLKTINWNSLQVKNVANIDIPASVTTIANGAFWNCPNLSVRIPEDSQLQTVGNGVFFNLKAVYTYENNKNLLILPASLTSVGQDGAFYSIEQLKKVIFAGSTAPTINNAGTKAFQDTNAIINVPQKDGYAGQFPGHTIYVGPNLTADNYTSPYTTNDGKGIPGLCDGDITTHWHTSWSPLVTGDATYGHYIDITVPNAMTKLMVQYFTRSSNSNATPTKIEIYTSNDGTNWGDALFTLTKETDNLPQDNGVSFTSTQKEAPASFTMIRFAITASKFGTLCGAESAGHCTALGELVIAEEIWTE